MSNDENGIYELSEEIIWVLKWLKLTKMLKNSLIRCISLR